MTSEPLSPRRRHILSSINPDRRSISPRLEDYHRETRERTPPPPADTHHNDDAPVAPDLTEAEERRKPSKFRFKSSKSRSHRSSRHRDRDIEGEREEHHNENSSSSSRRHHRRPHRHTHNRNDREDGDRHHHRHKRRRTAQSRSPTPPDPFARPPLDTNAAFRESLFDAMADDEGASYWEGVYGQPIHVYSQERQGPMGELERMDDDEYATFVRQKMWEKTHEGLLEERARREERKRQRDRDREEATRLTREMESSLRRGEERRKKRSWKERWEAYLEAWRSWDQSDASASTDLDERTRSLVENMAWPTHSGRREDVADAAAVRDFFVTGLDPRELGEVDFLARLKEERVRWHPDKIQQKLGGKVDQAVMRDVTAVFQIVDKLWSDTRSKAR